MATNERDRILAEIDRAARNLAEAREDQEQKTRALTTVTEQFEAQHAPLIGAVKASREKTDELESVLRGAALRLWEWDTATAAWYADAPKPDKKPHPAIGIRVSEPRTEPKYELHMAYGWALQHGVGLALDRKAFETHIAALPAYARPGWYWERPVSGSVQVTIATDLRKALKDAPVLGDDADDADAADGGGSIDLYLPDDLPSVGQANGDVQRIEM